MKTYIVGGAVRDRLLGHTVQDIDWVVVGSSPKEMIARGFKPVGKDFPVFLHPKTNEEYALARTERKIAAGYHGFAIHADPSVRLEEDLQRRDLTINAMAQDDLGELIDPFNGYEDLRNGILRHVSAAFSEDPVRILRVARFAARFNFSIAPETMSLMQEMVHSGEVDSLVPERIWQEMSKALAEDQPSIFFKVLRECGALAKILPEIDVLYDIPQRAEYHPEIDTFDHTMRVIDYAAKHHASISVRFAGLTHDLGKGLTPKELWPRHKGHEKRGEVPVLELCERLKVPKDIKDLSRLACLYHIDVHKTAVNQSVDFLKLFKLCDAFRRPERFYQMLEVCTADQRGRLNREHVLYPQAAWQKELLQAALSIDTTQIVQNQSDSTAIAQAIEVARLEAIEAKRCAMKMIDPHY